MIPEFHRQNLDFTAKIRENPKSIDKSQIINRIPLYFWGPRDSSAKQPILPLLPPPVGGDFRVQKWFSQGGGCEKKLSRGGEVFRGGVFSFGGLRGIQKVFDHNLHFSKKGGISKNVKPQSSKNPNHQWISWGPGIKTGFPPNPPSPIFE